MDMPMHQILRVVLVHHLQKAGEALMGVVLRVAIARHGGVGQDDVHPARLPDAVAQAADAAGHLGLRVLVGPAAVQNAAPQPQDAQAPDVHQTVLNALAALGRMLLIGLVVVPVDVEQGLARHGHQEGQIFGAQIAAGQDEVDALQAARLVVVPEIEVQFLKLPLKS